jgi:protein CASC3
VFTLQESIPPKEKKLDDDEDRRNPQYIPKRGTFYEHDDRTVTEDVYVFI